MENFSLDDVAVQSFLPAMRRRLQYANDGSGSFKRKMSPEDRKCRSIFDDQDLCRQWSIADYPFQRGIPSPLNSDPYGNLSDDQLAELTYGLRKIFPGKSTEELEYTTNQNSGNLKLAAADLTQYSYR